MHFRSAGDHINAQQNVKESNYGVCLGIFPSLSHYRVVEWKLNFFLNLTDLEGPSINNLVSANQDGHLKKKVFRSLAPLVNILWASRTFEFRRKVRICAATELCKNHHFTEYF